MTSADVERWLEGMPEEALELQKPAPNDAIVMRLRRRLNGADRARLPPSVDLFSKQGVL
jgi:hypothetical protein